MKILSLLLVLLLPAFTVARAQSSSPSGAPNYFGNTNPSDTNPSTQPAAPAATNASESAGMKKVADLLKLAKDKLQSTTSTTPKADALPLVEAARNALKQQTTGDGRYHGHRATAQKDIREVIAALKAGDKENKAAGQLTESIAEVFTCQGLVK